MQDDQIGEKFMGLAQLTRLKPHLVNTKIVLNFELALLYKGNNQFLTRHYIV
jgi:hypothetical protein